MTKEIDITPKTHILTSMARQDMAPSLAIVELIDNSLDAQGDDNRVDYDVATHVITISDNGVGAPDPSAIVTMGEHDSEALLVGTASALRMQSWRWEPLSKSSRFETGCVAQSEQTLRRFFQPADGWHGKIRTRCRPVRTQGPSSASATSIGRSIRNPLPRSCLRRLPLRFAEASGLRSMASMSMRRRK
jgi:hypothetical protein